MTEPDPKHYNIRSAPRDLICDGCKTWIWMGMQYAHWPRKYLSEFYGRAYHIECNRTPE